MSGKTFLRDAGILLLLGVIATVWLLSAAGLIPPVVAAVCSTLASIIGLALLIPESLRDRLFALFPQKRPKMTTVWIGVTTFTSIVLIIIFILVPLVRTLWQGTPPKSLPKLSCESAKSEGIYVLPASDGEQIGVSYGCSVFDTNAPVRKDVMQKLKAADELRKGDTPSAEKFLEEAVKADPTDAEAGIYLEDLKVMRDPNTIALVIGTTLTQNFIGDGRDNLQGSYVAQMENNQQCSFDIPSCPNILLLIANVGNDPTDTEKVAVQIVTAAHANSRIVGVMGWPLSIYTHNALSTLAAGHIPLVSPTSSDDHLTGHYFTRMAPSNQSQADTAARYAAMVLHVRTVAIVYNSDDLFSQNLSDDFSRAAHAEGLHIAATESMSAEKSDLLGTLQKALNTWPGPYLLYYAGHAGEAASLFKGATSCNPLSSPDCPWVMGSNSLYVLQNSGGYPAATKGRLFFTAYASPDAFGFNGVSATFTTFFSDYCQYFDANDPDQQTNCTQVGYVQYGSTRAEGDVLISYDTMQALMRAIAGAAQPLTADHLETALKALPLFQGVSGCISLDPRGTITKTVLILSVDEQGFTHQADGYTPKNLYCP